MKKILFVSRGYPVNTRDFRIVTSIKKFGYNVKFCTWNRNNLPTDDKDNFIYHSNEGYGKHLKKLFGMPKYFNFLSNSVRKFKPDVVIASHWDMLILCGILRRKYQTLIYENLDMPSFPNSVILTIIKRLEKIFVKKADAIIYASRYFKNEYQFYNKKTIVVENKPLKKIFKKGFFPYKSNNFKISFIGTLRYFHVMKNLIDAVEGEKIDLLFFGSGPDDEKMKNYIKNKKQQNVHFFGKYKYDGIHEYYNISDLIWAVYPSNDYNVRYAISNKYYESIVFEKPCVYAENTYLGNYVFRKQIGFVTDPYSPNAIKALLKTIIINGHLILEIKNNIAGHKKKNKNLFWEDEEIKLKEFLFHV